VRVAGCPLGEKIPKGMSERSENNKNARGKGHNTAPNEFPDKRRLAFDLLSEIFAAKVCQLSAVDVAL